MHTMIWSLGVGSRDMYWVSIYPWWIYSKGTLLRESLINLPYYNVALDYIYTGISAALLCPDVTKIEGVVFLNHDTQHLSSYYTVALAITTLTSPYALLCLYGCVSVRLYAILHKSSLDVSPVQSHTVNISSSDILSCHTVNLMHSSGILPCHIVNILHSSGILPCHTVNLLHSNGNTSVTLVVSVCVYVHNFA